jgi:glycosyltransferase 2 family protein
MTTLEHVVATAPAAPEARSGRLRRVLPTGFGLAVLAIVVARLGVGPFVDGLRSVDAASLITAVVVGAVTTVACALRWRSVSAALGTPLAVAPAVAAVYRAQLLNVALPGGVMGDVHRGAAHLRAPGGAGAARAVAWERIGGQVVLGFVAVVVLTVSPVGVPRSLPLGVAVVVIAAMLLLTWVLRSGRRPSRRGARVVADDLAACARSPRVLGIVTCTSTVVVVGHAITFVVAAQSAGATVSWLSLVPVAVLVLVAMSVPTHVAGWGLREGAAAWAFSAAGLGATVGVRAAVVYAVVTTVAVLPGLVVLAAGRRIPTNRRTP